MLYSTSIDVHGQCLINNYHDIGSQWRIVFASQWRYENIIIHKVAKIIRSYPYLIAHYSLMRSSSHLIAFKFWNKSFNWIYFSEAAVFYNWSLTMGLVVPFNVITKIWIVFDTMGLKWKFCANYNIISLICRPGCCYNC